MTIYSSSLCGLGLLILTCAPFSSADSMSDKAVLNNFFETLSSLEAKFKQSLYDEDGDLYEESFGTLHIARPGKFRWEYKQPYPQLLVSDGESIWIYEADLEQVTVKPFDQSTVNTPALLLSRNTRVEDTFKIEVLTMAEDLSRFSLLPKSADAQFERIDIGFKDDVLAEIKLHDNLGQTTFIKLSDRQHNHPINNDLFQFTPPAGADINVVE